MPAYGQPAPKKKSTGKIIAIVAAVLIALCCCGGAVAFYVSDGFNSVRKGVEQGVRDAAPAEAKVGDCVKKVADSAVTTTDTNLTVVDCTSADASGKVLGIVSGISKAKFTADDIEMTCAAYPTVEQAYWEGAPSSGKVWCVGPVK
jgi:hypothetical protein